MAKFYDRAWMSTATAGTGTLTLGTARTGYFTFAEAGVANGDTVSYVIEDGDDFEIGTGVYTSAGTTLTRASVTASKIAGVAGTSKINLSGNANVFITARKADLLSVSESQTALRVYASPSGGAGVPTFRQLVAGDIENQSANGVLAGPASGAAAAPTFRSIVTDDFGTQTANKVLAGPTSGGAAKPSFRDMVTADLPEIVKQQATNTDTAINSVTNVTLISENIASVVAGDHIEFEAFATILNTPGLRVYTFTIEFGSLTLTAVSFTLPAGASSRGVVRISGKCAISATNLAYCEGHILTSNNIAANAAGTIDGSDCPFCWNTTTSDLTGTMAFALKVKSNEASATQTLTLHSYKLHKLSSK